MIGDVRQGHGKAGRELILSVDGGRRGDDRRRTEVVLDVLDENRRGRGGGEALVVDASEAHETGRVVGVDRGAGCEGNVCQ